jgi:hypothetical protein
MDNTIYLIKTVDDNGNIIICGNYGYFLTKEAAEKFKEALIKQRPGIYSIEVIDPND